MDGDALLLHVEYKVSKCVTHSA